MKFSENAHIAMSRRDFWSFITELVGRNPNLGIPALEDGLCANLFIFDLFARFVLQTDRNVVKVHKFLRF